MAVESGIEESGATVSLNADMSGWDRALDKAAANASSWGDSVTGAFQKVNSLPQAAFDKIAGWGTRLTGVFDGVAAKAEAVQGKLQGWDTKIRGALDKASAFGGKLSGIQTAAGEMGDKASAEIGSSVGTALGGAIGTFFGPGVGTVIGARIGSELGAAAGDNVDLTGILGALSPVVGEVKGLYDSIGNEAKGLTGRIKNVFKAADFDAVLKQAAAGDWNGVWGKIEETATKAFNEIGVFAENLAYKAAKGWNDAFQLAKEPLAKVVDLIQRALTELGLAEEDTFRWGDGLRNVGDITAEVFENIGFGAGYLEGIFKKLGGYVYEYLILPLGSIGTTYIKAIGMALTGLGRILKEQFGDLLPAAISEKMEKAGAALKRVEQRFSENLGAQVDKARALQDTDIEATAKSLAKAARDALAGIAERNKPPGAAEEPAVPDAKPEPEKPWSPYGSFDLDRILAPAVAAAEKNSAEAQKMILASLSQRSGLDPLARLADTGRQQLELMRQQTAATVRLADAVERRKTGII